MYVPPSFRSLTLFGLDEQLSAASHRPPLAQSIKHRLWNTVAIPVITVTPFFVFFVAWFFVGFHLLRGSLGRAATATTVITVWDDQ